MCFLPKHLVSKGKQFLLQSFVTLFLGLSSSIFVKTATAQFITTPTATSLSGENTTKADVFSSLGEFIENVGQYGNDMPNYATMGKIQYGYEGFEMPVLFTSKGIIHLQRKLVGPSEEEREAAEREEKKSGKKGTKEEELEQLKAIDRTVVMEWLDANPDCEIITSTPETAYHTYGFLTSKAKGYKKITYANLYDGIDVELSLDPSKAAGFEYKIIAQAGADISKVKMKYAGDVKKIRINANGDCIVKSDFDKISITAPIAFYKNQSIATETLKVKFNLNDKVLSFEFPDSYDHSKALVIDPFVSSTATLTGANLGKAKDVDFDYAGNVYVTGGGDGTVYKLAKFDATGALQWTFNGSMTLPTWSFGTYYGGWVVEKTTGNVYLGQGFAPGGGFRIIRMSTTGLYDNYVSTANPSFMENWKMYWNCNFGSAQLLIAGGGTNSNINMGVCTPPSTVVSSNNVTGIAYSGSTGWAQDMVDLIIDPLNNEMYTMYASLIGTTSLTNKIYKNTAPYSGASVSWSTPSGYTAVQEIQNRPYLAGPQIDNSANILAVNSSYFFYWDGKNLKAFDKASGSGIGTPITIAANGSLMCGGIIADECNNVFVGSTNGVIKVYNFNGSTFNDAAAADIVIPGFGTASVYDLAYYESQKLLYASGNGFVASFDVASYACTNVTYSILTNPNCATLSVTSSISPAPPVSATVTYTLYSGTTQLASNTTGTFNGLSPNVTYTIKAFINLVCSGIVSVTNFTLPGPTIGIVSVNTTCGNSTGSITASGSLGTAPYSYSKDGVTFQASGVFSGLIAGIYTITVKDVNGCFNTKQVTILNSNGPTVTCVKTDAICGTNNGTATATGVGGVAPLEYSVNGGVTYQSNNFFTGLVAGTYTLTVKDANNCSNAVNFTVNNLPGPQVTAIPSATFCNSNNGSINAYGSGGASPLQYSINGNVYQSSGLFTGLAPGAYTVTVKDVNGCLSTIGVNIPNSPAPTVSGVATAATCNNSNGSITATGVGGTAPLQFSDDGINFQLSNYFYGLTAGVYTITVKDANNCTSTASVTVTNSSAPLVTVTSTLSSCAANTGTITASGSGGFGALQYSINGITFQASTLFSGLGAGMYTVLVRDANGCLAAAIAVIGNTAAPTLSLVVTPTACAGSNGIITANGAGGTPPLQYSKDGITFQASGTFSGLSTGPYTILVKDANGCTASASATMTNVAGLSVTASNVSSACSSNTGFINASGIGGAAPLQYSINGVTFQASPLFTNLGGGTYTITVKDANGCKATTIVDLIVSAQPQISATAIDANCTSSNGIINAIGSGGTAPLEYSINGIAYQSSPDFLNVAAGVYTVYVRDAANCIQTTSVTVNNVGAGPGITSFTLVGKDAYICNGSLGKITNPKVNGATCGSCSYSLDGGAFIPNATQLFLNVSVGVHTVTAMDVNGCTKTISVTIGIPANSTASAVVTGTACNTSNGQIVLTGIGPNSPYHVSMNGIGGPWITFDPSTTFTGLAPGAYTFILADDESFDIGPPIDPGGCLDTITVIVPAIGGPTIVLSESDGTCDLSDGSISALGSTGIAPLMYSIDGGANYQSSEDFYNLSAGTYTVIVQDGSGCESSMNITVGNTGGPQVSASATTATCGNSNGTITAVGSGGTAPLEYSINTTVFQASPNFTNVSPGAYTVYVKDANGCYGTDAVVVTNTAKPKVTAYAVSASCNSSNGALIAVGTLGTAPYQFSIDGVTFQSSTMFSNLAAGAYTITIKDASGCLSTTIASVPNILAPTVTLVMTPSKCFNANGSITATGVGGVAPLQYSIDGITFQAANVFSNLLSGSYTITVKDANGCQSTKNIIVTNTLGPQVLTATFVNSSCGNPNGSITAAASGGVGPLSYSIDGITFQAGTTFSALAAGTYTLTVKDANNCLKTTTVTLINLPAPSITLSASPSSCFANDGTVTAIPTGGTGALTYSKNGVLFQISPVFTGLAPGPYTITIKDSKGCTATATINVGSLSGVAVSGIATPVGCLGPTGSITASGLGGAAPYQFSLDGITFQASNVFNGLAAATYTITIKDANNCIATSLPLAISNSSGATVTAVSTASICGGSTGTVTATGIGGTAPYQFSLDGITYQASNVFTGLAPAGYIVSIKDASNCINTSPAVIVANSIGAVVSGAMSQTTCGLNNGSITVSGVGGATPYQYSINGVTFQASNIFNGLSVGTYILTIKDANNCITNSPGVNVSAAPLGTVAAAGVDQLNLCAVTSTSLTANTATVGTGQWSIVSGAGGAFALNTNPTTTFTGTLGTTYVLRWTISNAPCAASSDDVTITFNANPSAAVAGADQLTLCGTTTATLAANVPTTGTGQWSIVSGAGGAFALNTNPTTSFTGTLGTTYVLRWTISNAPCAASSDDVTITFNANPSAAVAGADQLTLCGTTTATLAANTPTVGSGQWSIVSGAGGAFALNTNPTTTFTGTLGTTYVLRWTISNAPCAASSDDVTITFNANPSAAAAGADQLTLCGTTTTTLAANTPTVGSGQWSIVSGAGGAFALNTNPTTTFTGTLGTTYVLRWTISNASCAASSDDVSITFNANPSAAAAGADQLTLCGTTTATLAANAPTTGTGQWSIVSGAGGAFALNTNPTTTFTGTLGTTYVLRWTISNAPCAVSSDDVSITFNANPSAAGAGADQLTLCGTTTATLAANVPTTGTGQWSIVSGAGGAFALNTNPSTTFTGTVGTTYVLRWTISNAPCTASSDDVSITFNANPSAAAAGADQLTLCGTTTATLAANAPTTGTGSWSIVSGAGGAFALNTNPTTTFTGTLGTTYVLRWTISNAPCAVSSDDVTITFNANPSAAGAGADQLTLCGTTTATLAANAPTTGTGSWSIVSGAGGAFALNTNPTTTFTGTLGTTYVLRWTISNAPCTASSDDVSITFNASPSVAAAGADQLTLCGTTTATLTANAPTTGTGQWSIVSGAGGTFALNTNPTTTFTGTLGTTYVLRWTISNAPCAASSDDVSITFNANPSAAAAGADQLTLCGTTTATLAANVPTTGTGQWSIVSGAGGAFALSINPTTTFTGTLGTTYVLRWTISNAPCAASSDDVSITFNANPSVAAAGADQLTLCGTTTATLAANVPTTGTGQWSIVSGAGGAFALNTNPTTTFTGTIGTTYVLRWTISNAPCAASSDDVSITFNANPSAAAAGADQLTLCGTTTATLAANVPTTGTGQWSIVSGAGGAFALNTNPTTTFTGTLGTTYVLRWTISNAPCAASSDDVTITFNANPSVAAAGADQVLNCNATSTSLSANTPLVGTGVWTIVSGTGGIITSASNPVTAFSGIVGNTYILRWSISNSPCLTSTDDVSITFNQGPSITTLASNASCGASNGSITASGINGTLPYVFSIDGITFQNSNVFNGLLAGSYTIIIKDANNCTSSSIVTNVNNSGAPSVSAVATLANCGTANGTITASSLGGAVPYQFSLDGITFQSSNLFTGLLAGAYTVTVKDANNCISASPLVNVLNPTGASVNILPTNASCGLNNGSITAIGLGGLLPYQFSLDGITFQSSAVFSSLPTGPYTVTIKDANNCISASATLTIVNLSGATVSAIAVNANCGASNGSITATGLGGATPYQFSLNGTTFQSSNVFNGLAAAAYTVTIKDANNCVATSSVVNVNNINGATVTAIAVNANCGASNGSITTTGLGGATPYQFSLDGITFQSSNVFSGLAAAAYTVTIKDANNCVATSSVVNVNNIGGATVSAIAVNANCGASNGSITATGLGGATPYQFSLDGITFQSSNVFSGLSTAAYTVTIKDANNCVATSSVVNVNNIGGATVSAIAVNANCGASNGSITATGLGGATPYQFSLDGITFQSSNVFNGLTAAAYTVTIKDANNCVATSSVVNVNNIGGATVSAIAVNANCGASNGSITATGLGGATPYQFSLDGITFQSSNVFSGLAAAAYTVTIKDANNCVATSSVVNVNNIGGATVSAIAVNANCGASNGSITATGLGGATPYQFSLDGITFQSSNVFNGLTAAAYTVTIKDANNCVATSAVVNVNNLNGATVTAIAVNANCGASNGSITATGLGGATPYQFSLDGITFQSSNVFNGLTAAAYTVTIKDANNCVATSAVVNVNNLNGATVTAIAVNANCGASNGSITATGLGGATPYQFSLDGITFQSSNVFNGLTAAAYTVTIKDANNCVATSAVVNVNNLNGAAVTAIAVNANCGASNGSITATGLGGATPYQFSLDGITFQSSNVFNGLAAAAYTVIIKDANNCVATSSVVNVNNAGGATVSAIAANANCGASNGSITATGLGGATPYQFSLDGITFQISNVFSGLSAAAYTVTIKDANNCVATSSVVNVNNAGGATVSAIAVNANCGASNGSITATGLGGATPYQFSLDGVTFQSSNVFNGLAAAAYTVTIKDANNCVATSSVVNVNNLNGATVTAIAVNANCGASNGSITATGLGGATPYQFSLDGITFQSSNVFSGLAAAAYTVTIKDANNCVATSSVVNVNNIGGATVSAIAVNANCGASNGSITATGLGGATPYQFSLDGITFQSSNVFSGLAAAAYTVTIKDANNCVATSSVVNVNNLNGATVTAIAVNANCGASNGSITATGIGGATPYQFSLDGITFQSSNVFNGLAAAAYTVTVKDANNCLATSSVLTIGQSTAPTLNVTGTTTICFGQSTTITATAIGGTGPYQYSWNNGVLLSSQLVVPPVTTVYSVLVKDANNCSSTVQSVTVYVRPQLALLGSADDTICEGETAHLLAQASGGNGGPYSYSWSPSVSTANSISVSPISTTIYTVYVSDGCTTPAMSQQIKVNVNPLPIVSFTVSPQDGCAPLLVSFASNAAPATIYNWNFGDNVFAIGSLATHTYVSGGDYTISLTATSDKACTNKLIKSNAVHVYNRPIAKFTADPWKGTMSNAQVNFTDLSSASSSWIWDFGDFAGSSTDPNPSYTYADTGHYQVSLIISDSHNCLDTSEAEIIIEGVFTYYLPNSFSPNNDGINDYFEGHGIGIKMQEMTIFDRWGKQFYYEKSQHPKWDGRSIFLGDFCPQDAYVYLIEVEDIFHQLHEYRGVITLIR
ncbi:MAG: gliding motility-associated C-terminal domain-containing protein [Bacteroidetes bacterium]|nr:gliding motility-associated C-terminal domain-containing protein [Bacteroidota bacterium]